MAEEVVKLIKQANQLMEKEEFAKAMSKFDKAAKTEPSNAEAWFGKAEAAILVPKAKLEDILEAYNKAAELDPKNPVYQSSMGSFCIDAGMFDEAEAAYSKAAEIDPDNAPYYYSEYAVEMFKRAPIVLEDTMDDATEEMIMKKSLRFLLKSIGLEESDALELLQRK